MKLCEWLQLTVFACCSLSSIFHHKRNAVNHHGDLVDRSLADFIVGEQNLTAENVGELTTVKYCRML